MTWGVFMMMSCNILYVVSQVLINTVNHIMGRLPVHNAPINNHMHVNQYLNKKKNYNFVN